MDYVLKHQGVWMAATEVYRDYRPVTIFNKEVVFVRCCSYEFWNSMQSYLENICEKHLLFSNNGTESRVIKKDILDKIPSWLDENEWAVIDMYYLHGLNQKDIGITLGFSESGISRIRARALQKIRAMTIEEPVP